MLQGNIQDRQETGSWRNSMEYNQVTQDLGQAEAYKYQGMEEGEGVQDHKMKAKIKKEYTWQIKLVLNSELNARNRIAAINTLVMLVVLYSYEVID